MQIHDSPFVPGCKPLFQMFSICSIATSFGPTVCHFLMNCNSLLKLIYYKILGRVPDLPVHLHETVFINLFIIYEVTFTKQHTFTFKPDRYLRVLNSFLVNCCIRAVNTYTLSISNKLLYVPSKKCQI